MNRNESSIWFLYSNNCNSWYYSWISPWICQTKALNTVNYLFHKNKCEQGKHKIQSRAGKIPRTIRIRAWCGCCSSSSGCWCCWYHLKWFKWNWESFILDLRDKTQHCKYLPFENMLGNLDYRDNPFGILLTTLWPVYRKVPSLLVINRGIQISMQKLQSLGEWYLVELWAESHQ